MSAQIAYTKHDLRLEKDAEGNLLLQSNTALGPIADSTAVWLERWAVETPDAVFIAERDGAGWRSLSYRDTLENVRALAAGLLARGVGPGGRILVLSGNSVDHGVLALAAQYIGAAVVPLAEQYSLIPEARPRLLHAAELTSPAMIYADDGELYGEVLELFKGKEILVSHGGSYSTVAELQKASLADVDAARALITPDSVAKILMTSGSSSDPKAVPTTHKMLCCNQAQLAHALPCLHRRPPVIVDWLPWNHVFGGSHNFNMILANGGTLYIDDGKPTEALFARTIENLKMHTGNLVFNVPLGFSLLYKALANDRDLAKKFFADLDVVFYAGASMPQDVWKGLENLAMKHRGRLPLMTSSWGLTETAPACVMQQEPTRQSGVVGVPLNGVTVKLVPCGDGRYEVRVKGVNIMAGYLKAPDKTADAFDQQGYFITGDAMAFVDESNPNKGLRFDGRLSEEFKLLSGTWVRVGALRLQLLKELDGLASDLVITGADRAEIGLMIFATPNTSLVDIKQVLVARAARGQSSSTRIARAILLSEPPSIANSEITAKGNLNFQKILSRRSEQLDRLYTGGEGVIEMEKHT